MKIKFLLCILIICEFWSYSANAQGGTLPLNGNISGNLAASTTDSWQVTTNGDGLLRLTFHTVSPADLYVSLYDNNGTTLLGGPVESENNSTVTLPVDGLAAGTYVVKITPYSTSSGAYTLSDSLFKPSQQNDVEPNGSRATALTLSLNDSTTGHVGYYYKNQRDTADWYKVTTTADGLLRVTLSTANSSVYSNNRLDVLVYLYDNDGVTQLGSVEVYAGTNPTTASFNTDGLAAGTYYIKAQMFDPNTEFAAYTLSDSLFTSPIANDMEPDSSKATALVLPLNDSTKGHIGYYYNNHRDSSDWYKVTTTADGLLRVSLSTTRSSIYSTNDLDVVVTVFDNDGITQLGSFEPYNGQNPASASVLLDGLAQGTYYIKVQPFNTSEFADYVLSDSLFISAIANDKEPNNSAAQADSLPLDATVTGHVGYYYNIKRDTSDWYKLKTTADGAIRISLSTTRSSIYSNNDLDVIVTVYDNDGITQLGSFEPYNGQNPASASILLDGYAAGTYYIKVQPYSTSEFIDYTLSDSLFTYNANDIEQNDSAYEARTILSNRTTTGHISFYKNGGTRDESDWFKINYTGTSGDLQFTFDLLPHISNPAQFGDVFFQVYKDTTASPIFNQEYYYTSPNNTINLTSLTQGYYYIHIIPYNSTPVYFAAYSIANSFTQVNIAAISLLKSASNTSCNTDSLIYKLSASHSPYTVRIYRNGIFSDSLITTSDSASFIGIKGGDYTATVFGDGATDNAFGQTTSVAVLPPVPSGLNATNITSSSATLNWSMLPCIDFDTVEYRASDTATWKILTTPDNSGIYDLSHLAGNVDYLFRVASVVSGNVQDLSSGYSSTFTFKTLSDLPVTLVNFSATAHNDLVTLNWSTATEINNKGFEIFRSIDGTNFTSIDFVAGAGTSNTLQQYQYTDNPGTDGGVFYRLKQVDLDGNFVWSNIVYVTINANQLITFMPNPAKSFITISSPAVVKQIRLLSVSGQIIKVWGNVSPNAQLDLGTIASGTYLIQFLNDQSSQTMKLVKE